MKHEQNALDAIRNHGGQVQGVDGDSVTFTVGGRFFRLTDLDGPSRAEFSEAIRGLVGFAERRPHQGVAVIPDCVELQQRLTVAEQRVGELEFFSVKQAALLDELGIPLDEVDDLFGETLKNARRYEYLRSVMAIENFPDPHPEWSEPSEVESKRIDDLCDAALKPAAEVARCMNCDRATVEQCDDAGCGFLGAGNGAPDEEGEGS